MSEYKINLDVFSGPLDLLLYLVRKEEVDIYDIPLAKITEEYIRYVNVIKMLDVDTAGEFLVMAATLMEIKSAMLLPVDEADALAQEEGLDPRGELIRQLLEYKKFKDAANLLRLSAESQENKFPRSDNIIVSLKPDAEPELDLDQLSVWDLLGAFDTIMKATGNLMDIGHIADDTPIDLYQIEILHRLQTEGAMNFVKLFAGKKDRPAMIGMFLAVLELAREKLITAEQAKPDMPIYLRPLTDEPAEQAVRNAILSQVQQTETEQANQAQNIVPVEEIENKQTAAEPVVPIEEYEISASDNSALHLDRQEVISEQDSEITGDDKRDD
jgi:segregation and condensation protein A